jgi:photosystem II stability/assembly factor-like uncharacterized protein
MMGRDATLRSLALLLILLILCTTTPGSAQWTRTAGPEGGFAAALYYTSGTMLAGFESGGIYRSVDSGATWQLASTGLTGKDPGVTSFASLGSLVYVSTDYGVSRSNDKGLTWTPLSIGFSSLGLPVMELQVHGTKMFLATHGEGVYRSLDSGATWTRANAGLADTNVNTIYLYGSSLYAGTDGGGVYRSVNDGDSWQLMSTGLADGNGKRVMSFAGVAGSIVAGTRTGAYYSTDSGVTWTLASSGLTSLSVPTLYGVGNHLFGGTYNTGVLRSTDGGINWSSSTSGWPSGNVRALCVVGNWIFGGNYGGEVIYRSTDNGGSWTPSAKGITALLVYSMTAANGRVYAGTTYGVARTTDNGTTWTQAAAPIKGRAIYSVFAKGGYVYAGTGGDGPYRSSDNGDTWAAANTGFPTGSARSARALAADTNWIYCATFAGMYRSSDNGGSWSAAQAGITDSMMESVCAWNGLVLAGAQNHVYRSTNSGVSWTAVASGLPSEPAYSIVRSDSVFFVAFYLGGNPSVYRSTDMGVTWAPASNGVPGSTQVIQRLFSSGRNVYGGATWDGVWLTIDKGASWTDVSSGLIGPGLRVAAITESGGYIFAGALKGGVWRRPSSQLVSVPRVGEGDGRADAFRLEQNYPNPFNPATVIAYSVHGSAAQTIQLRVFDLLGREVATLVNGRQEPGRHSATFDAAGHASGVYYYMLSASGQTDSRRMLLIK